MGSPTVYARGLMCCSVCAPSEMEGASVAAEVERTSPAGTESGWQVSSDGTFATGQPNPCPCNTLPDRRHWLLEC